MPKKPSAIMNISKGLLNVSLASLAAIGNATGNVWVAGATAVPAALATSDTLELLLRKKQEERLELPMPTWWTQGPESWQTVCSNIENHLPEIIMGIEEELHKETNYPSSSRIKQIFVEQVAQHLSRWDVLPQDCYLVAGYITSPLLEKLAVVLKPIIDTTREDAFANWQASIADTLDTIQKSTTLAPSIPLPTAGNHTGRSTFQSAGTSQDLQVMPQMLEVKRQNGEYDVYICYDKVDEDEVFKIGEELKTKGILPWFDSLDVKPGGQVESQQEEQIERIPSAAVFIGNHAIASGQALQMYAFIRQFVNRGISVIPVLLKSAPQKPKLPVFLAGFGWIDFHKQVPEPMGRLLWGITGIKI